MLKTENIVSEINFMLSISENFWNEVRKTTDHKEDLFLLFLCNFLSVSYSFSPISSYNSPIWGLDYLLNLLLCSFSFTLGTSFSLSFYLLCYSPFFLSSFCFFPSICLSLSIYAIYCRLLSPAPPSPLLRAHYHLDIKSVSWNLL
jgi:hypothetical protein